VLDGRRIDLDRHITSLAEDDPARDILWQELEAVLAQFGQVVNALAKSHATRLPEIRAKADMLAALLRSTDHSGPIISDDERSELALSLTEDIARLTIG
jgi:hypothetical protein